MYIYLTSLSRGLFIRTIRYSLNMQRDINDYVVAQDITNHLQVKHGDAVTISAAAFKQLKREKHFWTTVVIGGTATALTFGAATGFVGLGVVGSEIGIGLTAAEIAAVGGAVGGTASAIGAHAYAHNVPQHLMLETVPFLGKVLRKDTKLFSELYHVEVEWYIPSPEGGYTTQVQWVDAHHLVKLRTKAEDKVLATKAAADQKVRQDAYDAQLKERHRNKNLVRDLYLPKLVTSSPKSVKLLSLCVLSSLKNATCAASTSVHIGHLPLFHSCCCCDTLDPSVEGFHYSFTVQPVV